MEKAGIKRKFTDEQIVTILKEGEVGVLVKEISRKHGISDATFYTWRKKFAGMDAQDVHRLKQLEEENAKLKLLLAEPILDADALKAALKKGALRPLFVAVSICL